MHQYGLEQAFLSLFIFRRFAREEERLQVMFFLWAAMMRTYDSHGKCCPCFISSVLPICIIVGLQKILGWLLHTSSVERFSENFDQEAVTYLIFFVGTP